VDLIKWLTQLRPSREVGGVSAVVVASVDEVAVVDVVTVKVVVEAVVEAVVEVGAVVAVTRATRRNPGCPRPNSAVL
jgi:hypothetical protein